MLYKAVQNKGVDVREPRCVRFLFWFEGKKLKRGVRTLWKIVFVSGSECKLFCTGGSGGHQEITGTVMSENSFKSLKDFSYFVNCKGENVRWKENWCLLLIVWTRNREHKLKLKLNLKLRLYYHLLTATEIYV